MQGGVRENVGRNDGEVIIVQRNQDPYQVVRRVEQNNNFGGKNNIANVVEQILAQNGLIVGIHRPNFVSALSDYILQTELPRG